MGWEGYTAGFEQGGEYIDTFDNARYATSAFFFWDAHQQGDAADTIVSRVVFSIAQMFTQPFAVVGCEDHDCFICNAQFIQRVQHAAHMVIDFADHAVISLSREAKLAITVVVLIALFIDFWREGWQGHLIGVV